MTTDALAAIFAEHEELRHVERWARSHERKASNQIVVANKERMPVGICPVVIKESVSEQPVFIDVFVGEHREVVYVELKQMLNKSLVVEGCGNDRDAQCHALILLDRQSDLQTLREPPDSCAQTEARCGALCEIPPPFICVTPSGAYIYVMRPLRYSINVTLDGCCDHRAGFADEELHRHAAENIRRSDALLLGRVTYEMMEAAFRPTAPLEGSPAEMDLFALTIDAAKKYVVSSTLEYVDWNAELVRGDLGEAVRQLKQEPGKGLGVGGVTLPLALAELGLIDEYEFVVHPRIAGHGPTLFAGLSKYVDLKLVSRLEFGSGAVAMRYELSQ